LSIALQKRLIRAAVALLVPLALSKTFPVYPSSVDLLDSALQGAQRHASLPTNQTINFNPDS
jgi:hypothetical protein